MAEVSLPRSSDFLPTPLPPPLTPPLPLNPRPIGLFSPVLRLFSRRRRHRPRRACRCGRDQTFTTGTKDPRALFPLVSAFAAAPATLESLATIPHRNTFCHRLSFHLPIPLSLFASRSPIESHSPHLMNL